MSYIHIERDIDLVFSLKHAMLAANVGVQVLPVPDIVAQAAGIRRVIVITESKKFAALFMNISYKTG